MIVGVDGVPQYGRLAAILGLLALNHCACLRNARRISYNNQLCGIYIIGKHPKLKPKLKVL